MTQSLPPIPTKPQPCLGCGALVRTAYCGKCVPVRQLDRRHGMPFRDIEGILRMTTGTSWQVKTKETPE